MSPAPDSSDHEIRSITVDGQKYMVSLRVTHDGVEYLGNLRFTADATGITYQDHGTIPGSTALEAVQKAKDFSAWETEQRCYRALAEKPRFSRLRIATDEMIERIKHLNRVVVGIEKGMIDPDEGQREVNQIQSELLDIVRTLRTHAGVEDQVR